MRGKAVIFISHRIREVFEITDRVLVMRDGRAVGCRETQQVSESELVRMMVGREIEEHLPAREATSAEVLMSVRNLRAWSPDARRPILDGISFDLHRGEVLGLAGLMGAGRSEILKALFGAFEGKVAMDLFVKGKRVEVGSPSDAIRCGIALISEDRKSDGLFPDMTVAENTTIASLERMSRWGVVMRREEKRIAGECVERFDIRVPSLSATVSNLSGGNQQKVILARWLLLNPEIMLLDEPTRGIDVGAKGEIYRMISEFKSRGMGIILVSSELPEVLSLSDRILVIREGKIAAHFEREEASEELIMEAATGARAG